MLFLEILERADICAAYIVKESSKPLCRCNFKVPSAEEILLHIALGREVDGEMEELRNISW